MNFHIDGVITTSVRLTGFLLSNSSEGGSVASAKAAIVSYIKFTHKIWIVFNGDSLTVAPPKKAINKATTFIVN